VPTLGKLLEGRHEVVLVVTRPDRKKGRGWGVQPTPVKEFVRNSGCVVLVRQPEKTSEEDFVDFLRKLDADIFIVTDYGLFLQKDLLSIPKRYCINLHPSLLPKYRGAAPVNRAILNGETVTGNTVIKVTERMDAGSIIMQERVKIGAEENAAELSERLSSSGADLILKALKVIEEGKEVLREQDEGEATFAPKLEKDEGRIDWSASAVEINGKIRGMQPWPGAFTYLDDRLLKILEAEADDNGNGSARPGTVRDKEKFIINTGGGTLCVKTLQVEGKKTMSRDEFLRGHHLQEGMVLG